MYLTSGRTGCNRGSSRTSNWFVCVRKKKSEEQKIIEPLQLSENTFNKISFLSL